MPFTIAAGIGVLAVSGGSVAAGVLAAGAVGGAILADLTLGAAVGGGAILAESQRKQQSQAAAAVRGESARQARSRSGSPFGGAGLLVPRAQGARQTLGGT